MTKKRKSLATSLDEVDRTMYSSFSSAANSLSQMYTQAMNQQKLSFQAGERHGLEKLYQWILRQQDGGSRVMMVDILNYLQHELDCYVEGDQAPPPQNHNSSYPTAFPGSVVQASSGSNGVSAVIHGVRSDHLDQQPKNHYFSNALSSPVGRSLQNYQISQGSYFTSSAQPANSIKNVGAAEPNFQQQTTRDSGSYNSNDASSMDMHADSPSHESTY
ncbi:unnamed protein product [Cuscuta epithymum]|uniref:Holocarboxylase synthetase n=1 Tax=Cuscuta epithymum TaxID=186058 RepID=A0AAV0EST6_9ASTE|nr:unnamed protein product [Cuscuta epithymum]CAH9126193.1 unnamed protein product [Cuscuta epithymum]